MNLTSVTADAGALLARLGYSPFEIGLLFNQPIVKALCEYTANNDTFIDYAYNAVITETLGNNKFGFNLDNIKVISERLTSTALADNILQARDMKEGLAHSSMDFKMGQLQVIKLFMDILSATKELNSFVQSTRFTASNSVGSSWGDYYSQNYRVDDYAKKVSSGTTLLHIKLFDPNDISSYVSNGEGSVYGDPKGTQILSNDESLLYLTPEEYMAKMSLNPLAFEQCAYDMKRKTVKDIFSKYFPYDTPIYASARKVLKSLTRSNFLNADKINSIHKEFMSYILAKQRGSLFDGEAMHEDMNMSNREFYNKVFPIFIQVLKNELEKVDSNDFVTKDTRKLFDLKGFLDSLNIIGNTVSTSKDYRDSIPLLIVKQGVGGMQNNTASDFTALWAGLYGAQNEAYKCG